MCEIPHNIAGDSGMVHITPQQMLGMSYKSATFNETIPPNDRVNRLFREINGLTNLELQALRDRLLNHNRSVEPSGAEHAFDSNLNLKGVCVRVLSRREIDVLTLVATGYSRREIGASLAITPNTAAKHVSSIYRKLNISTIAEATRIALENGVIASNTPYR